MILLLTLSLAFNRALAQEHGCMSSQFRRAGDYILGGLFPFRVATTNLSSQILPELHTCGRFHPAGWIWALGMKFAIEEINNSTTLLPGVTLGYDIYDNCMEPSRTLQPSLLFLSKAGTSSLGVLCDYTGYPTRVMAVIGPHNSELCMVTSRLFSLFLIPQVSYGATTEKLNNERLYPSFFRSVPSDKSQLEAMVQLLGVFQWNWISVVASDDGYGREGLSLLPSMVANKSICVAYEGLIPSEVLEPGYPERLKQMIQAINETNMYTC